MERQQFLNRVGKRFMQVMLCCPLHALLSRHVMLITVRGRKSGKVYTTPVNYVRQGDMLTIVSLRNRRWWRNLRGGSPVVLRLQGHDVQGWGTVIEDDQGVAAGLAAYLQQVPDYAKYFGVTRDSNGQLQNEDVARAAHI
ncbi:MAG TPA: nitroreductase family deazaflavin-dependent oxidoreductase, partial [Roseiflexaceae bacterium]|nr:nitroreductase family deazaflavin-dependent oxidoreductase [Roseiflexaceae bacterium]